MPENNDAGWSVPGANANVDEARANWDEWTPEERFDWLSDFTNDILANYGYDDVTVDRGDLSTDDPDTMAWYDSDSDTVVFDDNNVLNGTFDEAAETAAHEAVHAMQEASYPDYETPVPEGQPDPMEDEAYALEGEIANEMGAGNNTNVDEVGATDDSISFDWGESGNLEATETEDGTIDFGGDDGIDVNWDELDDVEATETENGGLDFEGVPYSDENGYDFNGYDSDISLDVEQLSNPEEPPPNPPEPPGPRSDEPPDPPPPPVILYCTNCKYAVVIDDISTSFSICPKCGKETLREKVLGGE